MAEIAPTDEAPKVVDHPDVDTRVRTGRAARAEVPRSAHGAWSPGPDRTDPIGILRAQEETRLVELVPIRHERMLASPFAFYRGAAAIMASDLSTGPSTRLKVQLCGDAHLANFGGFASPERSLVFDMNDFDETNPGPFEWDVKRLATSFEIAARSTGFPAKRCREVAATSASAYRTAMHDFAGMSNLDKWYAHLDVAGVLERWRAQVAPAEAKRIEALGEKARTKDSMKAFAKLTETVDGEPRIVADPPLIIPLRDIATGDHVTDVEEWLRLRLRSYRQSLQPDRRHLLESYRLVDVAHKVVGVGSVGTRCWIALMLGKDDVDPLFLQVKEAPKSVLEPYTGASVYRTGGRRVVEGQRLLQASGDILLGWLHAESPIDGIERDFYVRQLWDWKTSPDIERMSFEVMRIYAEMCGWTLARGHARSGDCIAIASYLGDNDRFDRAIADFAYAYADQNERDYAAMQAAYPGVAAPASVN
ncbi:MAG: DUF2252 domain-containing protein [Acidimicrobiia bacterium]